VAPSGHTFADVAALAQDTQQRGPELIVITHDAGLLRQAHMPLPLPADIPEWLSPLVAVLPGQLFALRLALAKGYDVDQPAGLTKVTQTC